MKLSRYRESNIPVAMCDRSALSGFTNLSRYNRGDEETGAKEMI